MTRLLVRQNGPSKTTNLGDTFTVTITELHRRNTGGPFITAEQQYIDIYTDFSALSNQLSPTFTVSATASPYNEIEAANAGVGFTLSATSSSSLGFATPVRVNAPAYYEIAGVPSAVVTTSTDYVYRLRPIGGGASGCTTDSEIVSGTITVNPSTSASYFSGVGQNPIFCDRCIKFLNI